MKNLLRMSLAMLACAAFSTTSFAGGPFGIIHVGKWQGAAYTSDKGAFSHCSADAKFDKALSSSLQKMPIIRGSSASPIPPGSFTIASQLRLF
jgi:hypothetical protein